MKQNRPFNSRGQPPAKTFTCTCGKVSKIRSRTNYPFGRKSKGITASYRTCATCKKTSFAK